MKSSLSILAFLVTAATSQAAITLTLPGNHETVLWTNLDNSRHTPVATTTNPWGPVAGDGGASAAFSKSSGTGYFFSGGIYGWHTGPSHYEITDVGPIADLETVILQARVNLSPIAITLSYNGGNQALPAVASLTTAAGSGGFGPIIDHAWQWDLSGVAAPITTFTVRIAMPSSAVIYSSDPMRLDQGDTFALAIPEPSVAVLPLGLLLGLSRLRKR